MLFHSRQQFVLVHFSQQNSSLSAPGGPMGPCSPDGPGGPMGPCVHFDREDPGKRLS